MKRMVYTGMCLMLVCAEAALAQGRLFMSTDNDPFAGRNGRLASTETSCELATLPLRVINLNFPSNGLAAGPGFLWAGQPLTVGASPGNTLRQISSTDPSTGQVVFTVPAGAPAFPATCCNEQMVESSGGVFYHAHWPDVIQRLALVPPGRSVVQQTFPQADVVGMASDGSQIWITKWAGRQVGIWDPSVNVFTAVFTTPTNAGGLAWDIACGVLWVGLQGGNVVPYDATGVQLAPAFQPFGPIADTIDGLAFVPD